jgi:hypothetical protein
MELLMLRVVNAARQLRRPVREDYVPPVEKIQNFLGVKISKVNVSGGGTWPL